MTATDTGLDHAALRSRGGATLCLNRGFAEPARTWNGRHLPRL